MSWFWGLPRRITCKECGKRIWKLKFSNTKINYWEKSFLLSRFYQWHECENPEGREGEMKRKNPRRTEFKVRKSLFGRFVEWWDSIAG